MKRIYIAGPMTGLPDLNFPAFNEASQMYRDAGWAVHNPASSFDGAEDLPYEMYMKAALALLIQSDAIALLPGWCKSAGARMEALCAQQMDLDFYRGDRIQRLEINEELSVQTGSFRGATTPESLANRLKPLVNPLGIQRTLTADTLRYRALRLGILDEEAVKPAVVAAGITRALRGAGFRPTDESVRSYRSGHPIKVWERA